MTPIMRSLLLLAAVGTVVWILYKIRKLKVKMEDSIYWIFFAGILLFLGLFPEVSYRLSDLFGVQSPANLIFLVVIFLLMEKIFTLSMLVSQLEEKVSVLASEVALRSQAAEKKIKNDEKELKKQEEELEETTYK